MAQEPTALVTAVHTMGVPVTDQDRALAFYVDVLGMEKRLDAPFGAGRWIEVGMPGGATTLALVLVDTADDTGVDTRIRLAGPDADAAHAALRAAKAGTDDEVMRMGHGVPPMFAFRDPDDNTLVLVELPE